MRILLLAMPDTADVIDYSGRFPIKRLWQPPSRGLPES